MFHPERLSFAFLSRHTPTEDQRLLFEKAGIDIVHTGDVNAFDPDLGSTLASMKHEFHLDGVIVVHPLVALHAMACALCVGVFENANRAPEGEKPTFEAVSLQVMDPSFDRWYPILK